MTPGDRIAELDRGSYTQFVAHRVTCARCHKPAPVGLDLRSGKPVVGLHPARRPGYCLGSGEPLATQPSAQQSASPANVVTHDTEKCGVCRAQRFQEQQKAPKGAR